MRSAVDLVLAFNRPFPKERLAPKLDKISRTAFGFFRGTFHLFAYDLNDGPFRRAKADRAAGPIVADLHTENFGAFRAITGDVVYDINDFDETTDGPYEYDLRRLAVSLILAARENQHRLGDGVNAAEEALRGWLDFLRQWGRLRSRKQFYSIPGNETARTVLSKAGEKSRPQFMQSLSIENEPGRFTFHGNSNYTPVRESERQPALRALPDYLASCLAPRGADPTRYVFEDIAFRTAGTGSLGRTRWALLLGKGKKKRETWSTLRLIEWKDALDSAYDAPRPRASRRRAEQVIAATQTFQLYPKRYLGAALVDGRPMQAREIGANDARFEHRQFASIARFDQAARLFGAITARVHLLGSLGRQGPRQLASSPLAEDDLVRRVQCFALAYSGRVIEDYKELCARKQEVADAWNVSL